MNKLMAWAGRVVSALALLPVIFSCAMKISGNPKMMDGFAHLGIPGAMVKTLIVLESAAIVLYAVPSTSVLGAIVLTGYMGGAICAHLRVGDSVALQTLIPVLAWLGLYLREPRLRPLLPLWR